MTASGEPPNSIEPRPGVALPAPESAPLAWWLRAGGSLRLSTLHRVGHAAAWVLLHALRFRRRVGRENMRQCFADLSPHDRERLLERHYREWGESGVELLKLAVFTPEELRARVRFAGVAAIHEQLRAGRPAMLLTGHQGNWEWLLQRLAVEFTPRFVCAYKPLHSAYADRSLLALRSRFGATMAPAKALPRYLARLRKTAHVVALAADQMPHSSPSRIWLDFLGRRTAFYPGPAELARRYGYAVYYMSPRRVAPGYYEVEFQSLADAGDAASANELTERYAARLAATIKAQPHDWAWGHRRWKGLED